MNDGLKTLSDADLSDFIAQCRAGENVLRRQRLAAMAIYDERESWKADGASSMASWAVAHLGDGRDTAGEEVRVAAAFTTLPAVASAFGEGSISWDVARAATEFVTPEIDEHMAGELPKFSAPQVRRMARRYKGASLEQARQAIEDQHLHLRWTANGRLRFGGELGPAEGAVFEKAIDFKVRQATVNQASCPGEGKTWSQYAADALVDLASQNLNASSDGARTMVSLHIDGGVLFGQSGVCEIECGPVVSVETAMRMICDATFNLVIHGDDGLPTGISRNSRVVPPHMSREIRHRDGGCRWRGCGLKGWVNIHHIVHWFDGGETETYNLVMLCWRHHRMLHEDGWRIEGDANGELFFIAPDGRLFPEGPTPLREDLKERIDRMTELQPRELQPTGTNGGPSP